MNSYTLIGEILVAEADGQFLAGGVSRRLRALKSTANLSDGVVENVEDATYMDTPARHEHERLTSDRQPENTPSPTTDSPHAGPHVGSSTDRPLAPKVAASMAPNGGAGSSKYDNVYHQYFGRIHLENAQSMLRIFRARGFHAPFGQS